MRTNRLFRPKLEIVARALGELRTLQDRWRSSFTFINLVPLVVDLVRSPSIGK